MAERSFDIAVIGAGIAGASVAAHLASEARVVLLEMESQAGYHTTGRSAAVFAPSYGPPPIRALTRASAAEFADDPMGLSETPLLAPRGALFVAREDQLVALNASEAELQATGSIERLDAKALESRLPLLRSGYAAGAIFDPDCYDIDVHNLHQGYLHLMRKRGGTFLAGTRIKALSREGDHWRLQHGTGTLLAERVVNATGAWADEIGQLAGAERIGLQPKRRTAIIVAAPEGIDMADAPLVVDVDEEFYLKPDAGRLLISPANEDPEAPGDVQPDEMDIAICIDRIERAFDLSVRRIESRWAGLRSFVADKSPVVGYSIRAEAFFWLAGQGGYGIQTAPALSRLAAKLVLRREMPEDVASEGLSEAVLGPARL